MFSVVIPLFNKELYIVETIRSVLNQEFKDLELVVINDSSTDRSLALIDEHFNDSRLKVISIPNSGVSVARNKGIKAASYPWIAFLDADDWWDTKFLAEIFLAIQQFPNESIFATGRCRVFKQQLERYANPFLPTDGATGIVNHYQIIQKYLPLINSSNAVIRKSLFDRNGYFRPGQRRHEDHDLWLRLCMDQDIVCTNKNLSFYRKTTEDSASQKLYSADDFSQYLDTLIEVKSKLTGTDSHYFKKYYQRFVFLAYLQNKQQYTQEKRRGIKKKIQILMGSFKSFLLDLFTVIPVYGFYKKMKGQGWGSV